MRYCNLLDLFVFGICLLFEPGTHWRYSYCYDVLGALIEVISGQSLSEFLRDHIFAPLGMKDATFYPTDAQKTQMPSLYEYDEKLHTLTLAHSGHFDVESGGAGLYMSLEDYGQFGVMLCNGGTSFEGVRVLGHKTVELMTTNHLDTACQLDFNWEHMQGYGYGLGVRVMVDLSKAGSNGNIGEYGWMGAAGTILLADPKEKLVLVYAQQRVPGNETYNYPRLRNVLYSCL